MNPATPRLFIRPSDAARALSVSPRTIDNWIRSKKLPSKKVGRIRLIRLSDLEAIA